MIEIVPIINRFIAMTEHGYDYPSLCSYIDSLKQIQESTVKSNVGGWQSDTFILSEKYQEHRDLYMSIGAYASEVASQVFKNKVASDLALSSGFFNKINFNDTHRAHVHPDCSLCSILYLNDGDNFAKTSFLADPALINMPDLNRNALCQYNSNLEVNMETVQGNLVFFPPHFVHKVTPHLNADNSRYTFACNWNFVEVS